MARPPDHTFKAEAEVGAIALPPAGDEIAAALKNGTLQVFGPSGQALRSWKAGEKGYEALAFSGGRRLLAGARGDGRVVVMDAVDGRPLVALNAHTDAINSLSMSRDGALLGTASDDGTIALFRTADGSRVFSFGGVRGEGMSVAVSRAGDRVAGGWSDTDVRIVSASTGRLEHTVTDLMMTAFALGFSPDGRLLACGCADGVVSLRDTATGEPRGEPWRHTAPIGFVAFSPEGSRIASMGLSMNPGTREVDVRVAPVSRGTARVVPLGILGWNALAFTPAGAVRVVSAEKETLKVWDVREPTPESRA